MHNQGSAARQFGATTRDDARALGLPIAGHVIRRLRVRGNSPACGGKLGLRAASYPVRHAVERGAVPAAPAFNFVRKLSEQVRQDRSQQLHFGPFRSSVVREANQPRNPKHAVPYFRASGASHDC